MCFVVIQVRGLEGHWKASKNSEGLYLGIREVVKLTSSWVAVGASILSEFESSFYLLYSNLSNLGYWYSISLVLIFHYGFVCAIKNNNTTTASQGKTSFSDESSDSHVLVYKLLTALGFIGMKDALFIVLWDERCIIYNTRITILFTLVTLKSDSFLVTELQNPL